MISFSDKAGQYLQGPSGDHMESAQSSCNHRIIFTFSAPKSHDVRTMSLRIPSIIPRACDHCLDPNYLKSCGLLMISVQCPNRNCAIYLRCVYGLQAYNFSKIVTDKTVEAMMTVNPYNDCLRWPREKGDLDIV